MPRLATFLAAAGLVLAVGPAALLLAPAPALADDPGRDPRCAGWEQHGAPAGVDLRLLCTASEVVDAYTGQGASGPASEPALPYAVAALVTGSVLAVVGVLATRIVGGRAGRRLAPSMPDAWWACAACRSLNADGRPVCYACHAPRGEATDAGAAPEAAAPGASAAAPLPGASAGGVTVLRRDA